MFRLKHKSNVIFYNVGIYYKTTYKGRRKAYTNNGGFKFNGIDRVDNSKGYTVENCVTACKICNMAKKTMSIVEFLNWVNQIYLYQIQKQPKNP